MSDIKSIIEFSYGVRMTYLTLDGIYETEMHVLNHTAQKLLVSNYSKF